MMQSALLHRLHRNRRARGAALVEAAVVIPVLLVFLGTIAFTHRSYAAKMDKQAATRAGTLFYASHACKGEIPADVGKVATQNTIETDSKADADASKLGKTNAAGAESAVSRDGNWAKSQPPKTTVNGRAVSDRRVIGLTRTVSAGSEVGCNEPVFKSKWTAVFQEIGSLYKSRGGF